MCLVHETHSWNENAALFQRSCYCVKHCKSTLKTHFSLIHSFPIHFVYIIFASENMHRIESNVCDMCVGMATSMGVRQQKQSITRLSKRWYGFKMYTKTILRIQNTRHSEREREWECANARGKGETFKIANKWWWEQESVNIYVNCFGKKAAKWSPKIAYVHIACVWKRARAMQTEPSLFNECCTPHFPRATSSEIHDWMCVFSVRMMPTNQITYFTEWNCAKQKARPVPKSMRLLMMLLLDAFW